MGEMIDALLDERVWPHPGQQIELIETHISYVLLVGDFAYKIKKTITLPFVDFSTLEARRRCCEDELRLNRRFAKELYLDVVPIGGTPRAPVVGRQPAIEYAVKMIRFPSSQLLDVLMRNQRVGAQEFYALAERVAAFHEALAPASGAAAEETALRNVESFLSVIPAGERDRLAAIGSWMREQSRLREPDLRRRERAGHIRECHGDMHLGNLVLLDDRIVPFDCIEFSFALRCIDTIDEVAFLVMDLLASGHTDPAYTFLNRYLEASGDYAGVGLLRFYLVHRALVRSYVRELAATPDKPVAAKPYLALAERLILQQQPLLVITRGLSGSGKTTLTEPLIARVPAIRIRSDVIRKRLHGLEENAKTESGPGEGLYTELGSQRTYQLLAEYSAAALGAGFNVVVDAAFLKRDQRELFAELAERISARLVLLDIYTDETLLRERIVARQARGTDASEADLAVLEYQLRSEEPIAGDEFGRVVAIDSSGQIDPDWLARTLLETAETASA